MGARGGPQQGGGGALSGHGAAGEQPCWGAAPVAAAGVGPASARARLHGWFGMQQCFDAAGWGASAQPRSGRGAASEQPRSSSVTGVGENFSAASRSCLWRHQPRSGCVVRGAGPRDNADGPQPGENRRPPPRARAAGPGPRRAWRSGAARLAVRGRGDWARRRSSGRLGCNSGTSAGPVSARAGHGAAGAARPRAGGGTRRLCRPGRGHCSSGPRSARVRQGEGVAAGVVRGGQAVRGAHSLACGRLSCARRGALPPLQHRGVQERGRAAALGLCRHAV